MAIHTAKNVKMFMGDQEIKGVQTWGIDTPDHDIIFEVTVTAAFTTEFNDLELRNFIQTIHNRAVLEDIPRIY